MSVRHVYSCDGPDCDHESPRLHSEPLMEGGFSASWHAVEFFEYVRNRPPIKRKRYYCSNRCMVKGVTKEYPPEK